VREGLGVAGYDIYGFVDDKIVRVLMDHFAFLSPRTLFSTLCNRFQLIAVTYYRYSNKYYIIALPRMDTWIDQESDQKPAKPI
jgi:hypothetical protein